MKLITWNSQGKFTKKIDLLRTFQPDIIIVPECESPMPGQAATQIWRDAPHGKNRGLGAFSFKDYSLELAQDPFFDGGIFLPIKILKNNSPVAHLLAVWTRGEPYPTSAINAVRRVKAFLTEAPTVIVGDFNSNAIWDAEYPGGSHTDLVRVLEDMGFESAYHAQFDEKQGQEKIATYYHLRKTTLPFHIDYIFTSKHFKTKINIGLGKDPAYWLEHSDHQPVGVDLDFV